MDTKQYLGKIIEVKVDRPVGSLHPKYKFVYEINYGYVPGTKSSDGDEIDVYIVGVNGPLKMFSGRCIAIIRRTNGNDDKLVVAPEGLRFTNETIEKLINFQEKWFQHRIISNE